MVWRVPFNAPDKWRTVRLMPFHAANPAVKRTHTGGAHLCTPGASGAPVCAAYFVRWASLMTFTPHGSTIR